MGNRRQFLREGRRRVRSAQSLATRALKGHIGAGDRGRQAEPRGEPVLKARAQKRKKAYE